jgi:hypothetical protein
MLVFLSFSYCTLTKQIKTNTKTKKKKGTRLNISIYSDSLIVMIHELKNANPD